MIQHIYDSPGPGVFYPLLNLSTAKIERLCLVDWQNGQKYKALEVQYIDNTENGRGVLVILNSLDHKVNVYFESSLSIDPAGYAIGSGLRHFQQTSFERAHVEIGPYGADLDVSFRDVDGDQVLIRIKEGGPKPPSSFSLLAPMGESIAHPEWMPLFLLSQFGFVRQRGTAIAVRFGEERLDISRLPFPIGGERVYYARYCADPFIIFFNKQFDGYIEALQPEGPGSCMHAGVEYGLVEHQGYFEIAEAIVRNPRHTGRVSFDPPFPDADGMADGAAVHGRFSITGDPLHGHIEGVYSAERRRDQVHLRLHPSCGWTPADQGFMLRLIFNLGKPFRNWPKTYEWNATLTIQKDGMYLKSGWKRL